MDMGMLSEPQITINITNMYSQTNVGSTQFQTSRLHRMSRITGSIRRSSVSSVDGRDNFKLAAINSIRKGIKNNDVSLITKPELSTKQEGGNTIDLATVRTHESFDKVRKEFDTLQKQKLITERLVSKLKEEVDNAKDEQLLYANKKSGASQVVEELEAVLEGKRQELEEATINKNCLTNMLNRLRADRITYGEKKFNLEQLLSNMKKEQSIINREGVSQEQQVYKAAGIKQTLQKQIREEIRKREDHLESIRGEIALLHETAQIDEIRQQEIKDIRERAHQDKGEDQKQWKQLLITHYFLGSFLTNKMDKEMEKFRVVETAFKNIKLATGITDAHSIVKNYLNRELVYGRLLDNIAEKEKKIEVLRKERTEIKKEHKEESNGPQLLEQRKVNDLHDEFKNLDLYSERQLRTYLERSKLISWVKRQFKKIDKVGKGTSYETQSEKENSEDTNTRSNDFKEFVAWVETQIQEIDQSSSEIPQQIYKDIEYERKEIMRVKSQQSDEEENSNLHTQDLNHLNVQRQQLLKDGEKFMKELKKRKEQQLRLEIELASLKKQQATSPVKKEKEKEDAE